MFTETVGTWAIREFIQHFRSIQVFRSISNLLSSGHYFQMWLRHLHSSTEHVLDLFQCGYVTFTIVTKAMHSLFGSPSRCCRKYVFFCTFVRWNCWWIIPWNCMMNSIHFLGDPSNGFLFTLGKRWLVISSIDKSLLSSWINSTSGVVSSKLSIPPSMGSSALGDYSSRILFALFVLCPPLRDWIVWPSFALTYFFYFDRSYFLPSHVQLSLTLSTWLYLHDYRDCYPEESTKWRLCFS